MGRLATNEHDGKKQANTQSMMGSQPVQHTQKGQPPFFVLKGFDLAQLTKLSAARMLSQHLWHSSM